MTDAYVLRVRVESGTGYLDVPLNGSERLEVWTGATPREIESITDDTPPAGMLPVYPTPDLVPFTWTGDGGLQSLLNCIRDRFQGLVGDAEPLAAQYDNAPPTASYPTPWARVTVRLPSIRQATIGGSVIDYIADGRLVVGLHVPLRSGDGALLALADAVDAVFGGTNDGVVDYGATSLIRMGARDGWHLADVHIPFTIDRALAPLTSGAYAVPDFEAAHNAIRARFETNVEDALSIKVQYDNAPPVGQDDERWIRLSIQGGDSYAATLSGGTVSDFRRPGVMQAQLFAPLREGDGSLYSIADTIDGSFRSVSAAGVTYLVPSVKPIGRTSDGQWWQVNVNCPFYFDMSV
ncbi:MAG: phage tail terminator-like protein [Rhodospirillaceae bacterium]